MITILNNSHTLWFKIVLLCLLFYARSVCSQTLALNHYVGFEGGPKWARLEYQNSLGYRKMINSQSGAFGIYYGYRFKACNCGLETGIYILSMAMPWPSYNLEENEVRITGVFSAGNMRSWVIPLRISKEFFIKKNVLYVNPALGTNVFMPNGTKYRVGSGQSNEKESTRIQFIRKKDIFMGIEGSLALGVRVKNIMDFYIKVVKYKAFGNTLSGNTITHSYPDGTEISGTYYSNGNSYALLFGLKYNFGLKK